MIFETSYDDFGEDDEFGEGNIPPDLRSSDLPSKRLLGKGLASIGYETEWKGVRYARIDFVAVPSGIFRREAGVLLHLPDHENVVKTRGLTVDKLSCSLVLDYMDDKLTDLLQKRRDLHERSPALEHGRTLQESLGMILQIAKGVEHLHKHDILHGDLKSRNILVTYMDDGDKSLSVKTVKVADFGLVQTKRCSMSYVSHQARKLDMVRWKAPEILRELFGDATALDPDIETDEDFTGSACASYGDDAYCFGLTCFQILTGEEPYSKRNWKELVIDIVSNKRRLKLPPNLSCPQELRELVDVCCDTDPGQRPPFFHIREKLEHMHSRQPWIAKEERKQLEKEQNLHPGPPPQVAEALRIIKDAIEYSGKFLRNKHECESLTQRLYTIRTKLKEFPENFDDEGHTSDTVKMNDPAFDFYLTVLRKAEALLLKSRESTTSIIPSIFIMGDQDSQAFEIIHADLDKLNMLLTFDSSGTVLPEDHDEDLNRFDCAQDLKEISKMLGDLKTMKSIDESRQVMELAPDLEKAKLVSTEKSTGKSDGDLPNYLIIDLATLKIYDPIHMSEKLSSHDDEDTDGCVIVHKGRWLGCKCALKIFKSGNPTWNRSELLKEVRSLMQLHHPHVVQLMGFAEEDEQCLTLMELMDNDLRHFMDNDLCHVIDIGLPPPMYQPRSSKRRPFTRVQELDIITQIAKGVYYLHEQGYLHGELKCSNILVKQIGGHIDVKICDFRSSQKLQGVWDPVLFREKGLRRRPRWTAPEVYRYSESLELPTHERLKKTDVYSFGMVCFEVVTGKLPFHDIRGAALEKRIATGELKQELPGELDPKLRGLIESCWELDPSKRPSFETICHVLNDIRASQLPVATKSSGKEYVQRLFRWIPSLLGYREERTHFEDRESVYSRWDSLVEACGSMKVDTVSDLAFPEFVRIDPRDLINMRLIGVGSIAELYEATWLGCRYAVKTFKFGSPVLVQREVKCLVELQHPSIVRLMGLVIHPNRQCSIVMEYMRCSLRQLIESCTRKRKLGSQSVMPFEFHEAVYIITRIALGMAFLHSRGVVHRDLKAENILVPEHAGPIDVKITDFALSELIDSDQNSFSGARTRFWRAPELFPESPFFPRSRVVGDHQPLNLKAADVFSFAMTCYEVVTGAVPLVDNVKELGLSGARLRVIAGLRPTLPSDLNSDLKVLIEECWDGKPERRPTFRGICTRLQKIQQELPSKNFRTPLEGNGQLGVSRRTDLALKISHTSYTSNSQPRIDMYS